MNGQRTFHLVVSGKTAFPTQQLCNGLWPARPRDADLMAMSIAISASVSYFQTEITLETVQEYPYTPDPAPWTAAGWEIKQVRCIR